MVNQNIQYQIITRKDTIRNQYKKYNIIESIQMIQRVFETQVSLDFSWTEEMVDISVQPRLLKYW